MAFASPSLFSWQVGPCPQVYKKKNPSAQDKSFKISVWAKFPSQLISLQKSPQNAQTIFSTRIYTSVSLSLSFIHSFNLSYLVFSESSFSLFSENQGFRLLEPRTHTKNSSSIIFGKLHHHQSSLGFRFLYLPLW